ncbi:hypothetical protein CWI42_020950 [Ordospora colligata]|uniref:Uncharacterized protein n=1 Tax=Ordospora colligata OC4 TaxID=1354746 RepID=A0A0B2ULZ9_9MICR|nr:uncharacterized protein M896_020960 [Ordospora colligata OC4]KHN70259.1 hypothetical protein M896_020960 [Ordospora colligata OC4]TBU16803.1 hypothetical protein CWI41_020970 [Ordospora colligata]TBU16911.1 hypothetical protein CWI40_020970 [Ordospora colligata]TBU19352.1 hypothetical protein CWI42_020950 [Ordospora colligata]
MTIDFVPAAKQKELKHALTTMRSTVIIVNGPVGCSKTHSIHTIARDIGLAVQYIESIEEHSDAFITNNTVYLIDIDCHKQLIMWMPRLCKMTRLIIETRTLQFAGKFIPGSITVNFNKVRDSQIRKTYHLTHEQSVHVDGNLHLAAINKFLLPTDVRPISVFHQLGRLLHSKSTDVNEICTSISTYGQYRFCGYLLENYALFMDISQIGRLSEGFSIWDTASSIFFEYLVWTTVDSQKTSPKRFISFKSFHHSDSHHTCTSLCNNR